LSCWRFCLDGCGWAGFLLRTFRGKRTDAWHAKSTIILPSLSRSPAGCTARSSSDSMMMSSQNVTCSPGKLRYTAL
jgi:hypothetical protein